MDIRGVPACSLDALYHKSQADSDLSTLLAEIAINLAEGQ